MLENSTTVLMQDSSSNFEVFDQFGEPRYHRKQEIQLSLRARARAARGARDVVDLEVFRM